MNKITDKQEIPEGYTRVTAPLQAFSNLNLIDPQILAKAADRGSRVHEYCEMYALKLFIPFVEDDCKFYFESFKNWFDNYVEQVICIEKRFNNDQLRLSGQVDLVCKLKGDDEEEYTLVDFKTPQTQSKSWSLQTAAYLHLANEDKLFPLISRRIVLILSKNGEDAKAIEYDMHWDDWELYLSALKLHRHFNG